MIRLLGILGDLPIFRVCQTLAVLGYVLLPNCASALRSRAHRPAILHSSTLSGSSAGMLDENGSDMPSASIAEAIVFAVYMPPHAPAPGHECRTTSRRSSSDILSFENAPNDWNASTMLSGSPVSTETPGLMVPPYTMSAGRLRRPMAMRAPGMFLSQPGSEMLASYHCRRALGAENVLVEAGPGGVGVAPLQAAASPLLARCALSQDRANMP